MSTEYIKPLVLPYSPDETFLDLFHVFTAGPDSIGAHYACNNHLFCTLDVAAGEGRRGDPAILDADNREWLSSNFGIKFGSITDLAKEVSR